MGLSQVRADNMGMIEENSSTNMFNMYLREASELLDLVSLAPNHGSLYEEGRTGSTDLEAVYRVEIHLVYLY
jgi:hypothetical protein